MSRGRHGNDGIDRSDPVGNPQVIYEGQAGVKGLLETITSWLSNDDGPEPGSRWSAPWTNDLDAGEDRRGMGQVIVAVHQVRVDGTSHLFGWAP
jgi:hypothetical protein